MERPFDFVQELLEFQKDTPWTARRGEWWKESDCAATFPKSHCETCPAIFSGLISPNCWFLILKSQIQTLVMTRDSREPLGKLFSLSEAPFPCL